MKAPNNLLSGRNLSEKWVILRKNLKEGGGRRDGLLERRSNHTGKTPSVFGEALSFRILLCFLTPLSSYQLQPLSQGDLQCHYFFHPFISETFIDHLYVLVCMLEIKKDEWILFSRKFIF